MDKNTLLGALLMGAILLGFMWLNQPAPNADSPMPPVETTAEQDAANAANLLASSIDSISTEETLQLAALIDRYGRRDSAGIASLTTTCAHLATADGRTLTGSVSADSDRWINVNTLDRASLRTLPINVADSAVRSFKSVLRQLAQYQGFAPYLNGTPSDICLENSVMSLTFNTLGARLTEAELKEYDSYKGGKVKVVTPDNDVYSFIMTAANREFDTRDLYFEPTEVTDSSVTMAVSPADGAMFALRYTIEPDSYVVHLDLIQKGMENVLPSSTATMDFVWSQKMERQEQGRMFEERNSGLYYKYNGGDVENLSESSNDDKEINEPIKWMAFKNQFFSMAFIARNSFNRAELTSKVLPAENADYLKELQAVSSFDYSAGNPNPASFDLFIGPNLYPMLSSIDDTLYPDTDLQLTRLIPLSWPIFRWINTLIVIPVFTFLGHWFTNYGIIILLLTLFIKLLLFPFTYKSYMSQAKMRLLAPEIKEINDKYPGQENAMTRQTKTMELYSRAGASPLSGCLPMLLQMPILIAIFAFFPSCIELRGEHFLWVKDLSAPDAIITWNANIPFISKYFGNHLSLFCLLMTVTNIIYSRITMASQPGGNAMPGMKMMTYLMPIMFLVFFNNYAAGLSYYYFLSLLITIIQTYIFRKVVNEDKMRRKMAENAKKPRKKSGFMQRLEEAQRQQQAMLREQQRRQGNRK